MTQPEALRLADELQFNCWPEAAKELRRLHEVNEQLLDALMIAFGYVEDAAEDPTYKREVVKGKLKKIREAIQKATGEEHMTKVTELRTKEQVIQAARDCNLELQGHGWIADDNGYPNLETFYNLAYKAGEKAMQDRAAKVCENLLAALEEFDALGRAADAIRALELTGEHK